MTEDRMLERSVQLLRALDFAAEAAALREEHEERFVRLLLSLFEVVDSFDRLLAGADEGSGGPWPGTVGRIARQLEHALEQAGAAEIRCRGELIDPRCHEIVDVKPLDGVDDDTILEVLARGWSWDGRLVRRARVVVARNPEESRR